MGRSRRRRVPHRRRFRVEDRRALTAPSSSVICRLPSRCCGTCHGSLCSRISIGVPGESPTSGSPPAPCALLTADIPFSFDLSPLAFGWWVLPHYRTVIPHEVRKAGSARAWAMSPGHMRYDVVDTGLELCLAACSTVTSEIIDDDYRQRCSCAACMRGYSRQCDGRPIL